MPTLDERRLLERDLADLAVERHGDSDVGGAALPTDNTALEHLVQLTDGALASRWFGWWYRWRLRSYQLAGRNAVEALAERAVIELRWRERQRRPR